MRAHFERSTVGQPGLSANLLDLAPLRPVAASSVADPKHREGSAFESRQPTQRQRGAAPRNAAVSPAHGSHATAQERHRDTPDGDLSVGSERRAPKYFSRLLLGRGAPTGKRFRSYRKIDRSCRKSGTGNFPRLKKMEIGVVDGTDRRASTLYATADPSLSING